MDQINDDDNYETENNNWKDIFKSVTRNSYFLNARYYEIFFEKIRKNEYPSLPSRQSCIYMCDVNNLEFWYSKFLKETGKESLLIYSFEADGIMHYADPEWLELGVKPNAHYEEIAKKYWKGEIHPDQTGQKEILFNGTLRRIDKFNSIADFKGK